MANHTGRLPSTAWKPGISGNPAGGKRAGTTVTSLIRSHVPVEETIQLLLALARGEPVVRDVVYTRALYEARTRGEPDPPRPPAAEVIYPTIDQQRQAIIDLWTWGYQKPAEKLEISTAPEVDLSALSDEELELYERLLAKAQVREVGAPAPAKVIDAKAVEVRGALPSPGR